MYIDHTSPDLPDGKNDMLGDGPPGEVELLRIALLNRSARMAKMQRELEDAQLHSNGLLTMVHQLIAENRKLREKLGMASLNPGHLPPRYPDSHLAKTLRGSPRNSHH